ncbi:MAG: hypothetical protein F9K46_15835 [Anaerolineae bacterium]|nr:MAG: hypothetical protein F9K46_15835 [Anaerolineae bacterium]
MGTPYPIADMDTRKMNRPFAETQFKVFANRLDLIQPSALFLDFGTAPIGSIKNNPVPSL